MNRLFGAGGSPYNRTHRSSSRTSGTVTSSIRAMSPLSISLNPTQSHGMSTRVRVTFCLWTAERPEPLVSAYTAWIGRVATTARLGVRGVIINSRYQNDSMSSTRNSKMQGVRSLRIGCRTGWDSGELIAVVVELGNWMGVSSRLGQSARYSGERGHPADDVYQPLHC